MAIIALDFDGVLCDSARETAVSAWRAARALWPADMGPAEPPEPVVERFVAVRPYLETGYQAIPMIRLVVDGCPESVFRDRFDEECERLMAALSLTREDLVARFGAARDSWIAADEADWLSRHRFYPGVLARLSAARRDHEVAILTTKQERFAAALLRSGGVDLPSERLIGFESGVPKEQTLAALLGEARARDTAVHFVEDRLDTLRRVENTPELDRVRLYYAAWGYGTPTDLAAARSDPKITVWQTGDFLNLI
jgi:phosphoglycolate phosphatase-like HAD superfamily hydrolase